MVAMSDYSLEAHKLAANTIRGLAMDAVQKAGNGHPGMPMGMADVAVVLWSHFLRHNPQDPQWPNRDRFVLSAGHGSILLYSLLHLSGYDLPMSELQSLRQWGSKTPGHPEVGHTPGVETTTGPLGQGVANAVGMALAERWLAARFNRPNFPVVDHFTYAIASDGDLMEGVAQEASSLAGHLGLSKLIVLYDDNHITIDGTTAVSFTEDVMARYAAYGWHTQRVDGHDALAVRAAIEAARAEGERPSIIACRTHIGFGSPNKQDSPKSHGSALGVEEVRLTKEALGWPLEPAFYVPDEARAFLAGDDAAQAAWRALWAAYAAAHPDLAATLLRMWERRDLPEDWEAVLPPFAAGKAVATRSASGEVLNALAEHVPSLLGGSGDLTGSNNTDLAGEGDLTAADFNGRYIRFGVREHAMAGLMNGMALHGAVRPYGGTFLVFSDYMRPSIRLAALMGQPVIYVFTHDSIGLGEDGPTHQPVEHLMALRAMPNLTVIRPADAAETAVAWRAALENRHGPTALILTRQGVPTFDRQTHGAADGLLKGAYVLSDADEPQVILIGTGSEVQLAVAAQQQLAQKGVRARVVSMPSWELFAAQTADYQQSVLPPHIKARVSIEAGTTFGWERHIGDGGVAIGLNHFGASAPYERIYEEFGITAERMAAAAMAIL
ncbi:MAG: transketolase [Ardenticatenaceae bacterium]|nr:transketolase [Ardenticatenaceae bacterium]